MRLNVSNYRPILSEKDLTDDHVCKSTGLSEKTLLWILENQYIEVSTLELIADTLGVAPKEIALPDYDGCSENVIEFEKFLKSVEDAETRTILRLRCINNMGWQEIGDRRHMDRTTYLRHFPVEKI